VPIKAIAVDMFPHTVHCELILFFTRYSNELFTSLKSAESAEIAETLKTTGATEANAEGELK
jgi:hypothetical protein